jgi:hypothetical protein
LALDCWIDGGIRLSSLPEMNSSGARSSFA